MLIVMIPPLLSILSIINVRRSKSCNKKLLIAAVSADLILAGCAIDAWRIEPGTLTVTRIPSYSMKIAPQTHDLKIVHISDIHFERDTPLTQSVLRAVSRERPDLVVLTGDLYQEPEYDRPQFDRFFAKLCSFAPTYCVTGYDHEPRLREASRGRVSIVNHKPQHLIVRGTNIGIVGQWANRERPYHVSPNELTIYLNHTPDMAEYAASLNIDWYFAGHTHGGQVRIPLWGAIVTNAKTGKRYEYGRYKLGNMDAFVTRGIGLEPRPAPQVRFLCPPEIVVVTISR